MLGIGCPIVTPYRSPTHHHRRKCTGRDARPPARAGSFFGAKRKPLSVLGGFRFCPIAVMAIEDGDIHGDGVNVAARLERIAAPGDISQVLRRGP